MSRLYCITYTSVGFGLIMSSFPPLANRNDRFMAISVILKLNRGFNLTINRGKFKIKRSQDQKSDYPTQELFIQICLPNLKY